MIGGMVGSYKITEMIGEGGMGAVYKGIDVMLEREVAIKVLRPELSRQPNLVERFRSEAVTLAKLNHPNIATLYSFLRHGDDFFMVMEFVRGETLDNHLRTVGAMPVHHAVRLFCRALEGIEHAHQMGIIHRDIKPANMMLTTAGSIKVMDFGIARVLGTSRMTRTGHLVGTIEYMSPEQVKGEETDARSDIYSLGMLLYEMLTGRLPFNSSSEYELMRSQIEEPPRPPTAFAPQISIPIEQTIMRALAKRPDARIQTARQFRASLEQALGATRAEITIPPQMAAPQTRFDEAAHRSVPSALPETRLGTATPMSGAGAVQPKETRLPAGMPQSPQHAGYQQANPQQPGFAPGMPDYQQASAAPSLLSRLNWKHYTSAGALLLSLILLPIVLFSGTSQKRQPESPDASVPSQPTAPPQSVAPSAAPLVGPNTPTAPLPDDTLSSDQKSPGSVRSTAARDSGREQRREGRSAPASSESDPSERRATRNSASRTQDSSPAGQDQRSARDDDNQKKNKGSKIGEATDAVGGAFKKLGGLFGHKKKDKEKKP
jgi:serine/threonine protein kinase